MKRNAAIQPEGQGRSLFNRLFPVNPDLAVKSIFGIWGAYFLFASGRFLYVAQNNADALFFQRILMTVICITFTWLLYRLLIAVGGRGMGPAMFMLSLPTMIFAN